MNSKNNSTAQIMLRETGIAVAVLAIYVLTLLLPLHQAAGLQRDLNAVGYSTLDSWSVCQPLAQDENGDPREAAALNCPATGAAKYQLATLALPAPALSPPVGADIIRFALASSPHQFLLPDHFGQSRAPPVPV
ncbi:hypothetical protein GGR20_002718 [Devosia subaequoris]|uniref:DUF2946 domain-containing protein n=1 Tax=Devosia subaequoris TaxID=395930 RepID=A0A7W6IPS4_9HYPH|nr:hypothetical protein [Devosia subaequoris]MBB4053062.1 hypothetical protein [Devosia subaequoris]MCP1210479.1 hypothetical protein [Devosia subaequoris]